MAERFTATLQENVITLLAYNPTAGKQIMGLLDTNLMEGEYRLLAERVADYWRKYNEPPGQVHTADLVEDIISDPKGKRSRSMTRLLGMMAELAPDVNTAYVVDQVHRFTKMQRMKATILDSAEKLNKVGDAGIEEVEAAWHKILQVEKSNHFGPGLRLGQHRETLEMLTLNQNEFRTGIRELDRNFVVPERGTVMMLLAAAGRGKTWMAIQIARKAIEDRKRVLHISLEMNEAQVMSRYYQAMLTVPKRDHIITNTRLEIDLGELRSLDRLRFSPKFALNSRNIELEMDVHLAKMGTRVDNLIVKRFPGQWLTGRNLRSYCDMLEESEGFIPDMVVIDYPRLMKQDVRDLRLSLDETLVDLRAFADERNVALIAPHQASKEGEESGQVKGSHASEAFALNGTVDTLVTYSCSDTEFAFGLGRVYVSKARAERDRFTTLITQNYGIGQFVIQSYPMISEYADMFKEFSKRERHTIDDHHVGAAAEEAADD